MEWSESTDTLAQAIPDASTYAGDQLIWRVYLYGFEIGLIAMGVGKPGVLDQRRVIAMSTQIESTATAAFFSPMRQMVISTIDVETLQPLTQRRDAEEGTMYKWVEVRFTDGAVDIEYRSRETDAVSQERRKVPQGVPIYDDNSLLFAARSWQIQPGERIVINVFREVSIWSLQVERAQESQTIETKLGTFSAFRLDCLGRYLKRDGTPDEGSETRKYSFWLSDDDKRLPLVIVAKSDYGDARMELEQYQPGRAQ